MISKGRNGTTQCTQVANSCIAPRDLNQILAYIEANEFLDARVLSLRLVDDDTVEVTTGVVRGPLNGGGHVFMARGEDGEWIVRHASSWVS